MGLDIRVNVTPDEVLEDEYLDAKERDLLSVFREACAVLQLHPHEAILTKTGLSLGLYEVRLAWIRAKGFQTGAEMPQSMVEQSHLLNHNDCEGWYLPEDFETPIRDGGVSIGSSDRLLTELLEINPATLSEEVRRSWFAVFAPAFASTVGYEPLRFA